MVVVYKNSKPLDESLPPHEEGWRKKYLSAIGELVVVGSCFRFFL